MAIEVAPLHSALGAEIRGVDLTCPVMPEAFTQIDATFNRYGILVFPDQPVSDEQQLAFSRFFGLLEVNPNYAGAKMRLRPDIADISNLDAEGQVLARDDLRNLFYIGNQLWHTDSSFKRTPRNARCCRPESSRGRGARPSLPICARFGTRCPRRESGSCKGSSSSTAFFARAARSVLPISTTRS
jgi:alpha-ketoglutarate-dependent taurine dioxygenase